MRDDRHAALPARRPGRRAPAALAAGAALCALLSVQAAQAQYVEGPRGYYGGTYGGGSYGGGPYGGPPAGAYEEPRPYRGRAPREVERTVPVGYNCDAVQNGLTGLKPYSCPLPGPRPLGVRCFCNLPVASFSPPQTAVGHVAP